MADNLAEDDLKWRIDLARKGDGELLAELLSEILSRNEPVPPKLCEFLVGVVAGKIILKPPLLRTRTFKEMSRRWLLEKHAAHAVEIEMRDHGKQRDKKLRTALTRKWFEAYGTTPAAVEYFLRHKPKPLTAGARAQRAAAIAASKRRKSAQK